MCHLAFSLLVSLVHILLLRGWHCSYCSSAELRSLDEEPTNQGTKNTREPTTRTRHILSRWCTDWTSSWGFLLLIGNLTTKATESNMSKETDKQRIHFRKSETSLIGKGHLVLSVGMLFFLLILIQGVLQKKSPKLQQVEMVAAVLHHSPFFFLDRWNCIIYWMKFLRCKHPMVNKTQGHKSEFMYVQNHKALSIVCCLSLKPELKTIINNELISVIECPKSLVCLDGGSLIENNVGHYLDWWEDFLLG